MAIKNTRTSIAENTSESRLKDKLKENFKKFLKEAPGDEDEQDDELGDDLDLGTEDDMNLDDTTGEDDMNLDTAELDGIDDMQENPIDNLTDTETEQVDHWIDELLGDSIEQAAINGGDSLDTEMMAGDLDPMGEDQFIHEDLPMTVDDMNNIIDSDESLQALEKQLADLAIEETGEGETEGETMNMDDDLSDEDSSEDELMNLGESTDPMDGIDKLFDQGYEGTDVKDDLQEDVELAADNKEIGMKKVNAGLNDKMTSKVAPTKGARTEEEIKNDIYKVVQESDESKKKSKMLVKAGAIIAKATKDIQKKNKLIESLKLENYKLIKANGILSVAGDLLAKEARTQISESFDKCQTIDQVNKFYSKLTEKIKTATRPSLNNTVNGSKKKISVIKENAENKKDSISHEQERINMLMGLNTKNDVYFE